MIWNRLYGMGGFGSVYSVNSMIFRIFIRIKISGGKDSLHLSQLFALCIRGRQFNDLFAESSEPFTPLKGFPAVQQPAGAIFYGERRDQEVYYDLS